MKSKLTRMKPEELSGMKFKEAKMILKKDLDVLQTVGPTGTSFFICTEFDFDDKKGVPMLVVGDLKGEWKKYAKEQTKPNVKTTAVGSCFMSEDGTTLTLNIERGKAKPKVIEKAISKGAEKIIPSSVTNIIFNETPKLEADDEIDATEEEESNETVNNGSDNEFKKVIEETKNYKAIKANDFKARLAKIKVIDDLILAWEKKNLPTNGDSTKEERNTTLQKLRAQLYSHRIDINVQNRQDVEPISSIVKTWEAYKKRPLVEGENLLIDTEDRVDSIADLQEMIDGWNLRNPSPYCKEEEELKKTLDKIAQEVDAEAQKLATALPATRKAAVKAMLDKLTKATPEQKEALKQDEMFLWELSRVVPVAQTNDARALLGLEPIKEEKEGDKQPEEEELDIWKDPEVQELFKDFAKFTTFEVAIDHRANPGMTKKIRLVAGTQIWKENKKPSSKFPISEDFDFELISEDKNGNMRLKYGNDFYYSVRTVNTIESEFKVLPSNTPLFPVAPSKDHVLQGGLGDCYLLGAVTSLVAKDPNLIIDMMLDKGDTVTVRLFDVKVDKNDKKTFTARYFNVDKSIPVLGTSDLFAESHLWVQILEKAYAAGGFSGSLKSYAKNENSAHTYEGIEGGNGTFAYEVLTGKQCEMLRIDPAQPKDFALVGIPPKERGKTTGNDLSASTYQTLPWGTDELAIYKQKNPKYEQSLAYSILNNDLASTIKWAVYAKKGFIKKLFKREFDGDYSGGLTIEDFELFFQGKMKDAEDDEVKGLPVLNPAIATLMIDWIKSKALYPGKRGSGIYSVLQLSLFKDIKEGLDNGRLVSLGSKVKVGRKIDGIGHSGGESKSGGLVGSHVYTVLKTRENNPLKEMEIRNPWGKTVQRNVTVSDRKVELETLIEKTVKKEISSLEKKILELENEVQNLTALHDNEADQKEKQRLKKEIDNNNKTIKKIEQHLELIKKPENLKKLTGKLLVLKNDYDKALAESENLKKKEDTELISVQEDKIDGEGGGEFWMLLDDLTKRFDEVYIG